MSEISFCEITKLNLCVSPFVVQCFWLLRSQVGFYFYLETE